MHASPLIFLILLAAGPAAAQHHAPPPPAPVLGYAPVYDDAPAEVFAGPRLEARVGWDHIGSRIRSSYLRSGTTTPSIRSVKSVDDGVTYGGGLGWDVALTSQLIVGLEAGIEQTSIEECSGTAGVYTQCEKAGREIEVGGRIGQALSSRVLVYAKAAYVNTRSKVTIDSLSPDFSTDSLKSNRDAVRFGAGLEAVLTPNLYLKGEYRYTDYRNDRTTITYANGDVYREDQSADRHQIVGAMGLRF